MTDQPKEEQDVSRPKAKASVRLVARGAAGLGRGPHHSSSAHSPSSAPSCGGSLIKYGVDTLKETKMSRIPRVGSVPCRGHPVHDPHRHHYIIARQIGTRRRQKRSQHPTGPNDLVLRCTRLLFFNAPKKIFNHVPQSIVFVVQRLFRLPDDPIPPPFRRCQTRPSRTAGM